MLKLGQSAIRAAGIRQVSCRHAVPVAYYSSSRGDRVVIIGGGAAGLAVASQLQSQAAKSAGAEGLEITIVEPSSKHYYQPAWTLVGAGLYDRLETVAEMAKLVPAGVTWLQDSVVRVDTATQTVETAGGEAAPYDWLVVACGVTPRFDLVRGLPEALGYDGVCSNYSYAYCEKTHDFMQQFKGGRALFTQPATPIKCGGAPQKIMYLADDYWRRHSTTADISFYTGGGAIFPSPHYAKVLNQLCEKRSLAVNLQHELVSVDGANKSCTFRRPDASTLTLQYDFLHVTPPMPPPEFIAKSGLANAAGYADVDKGTLRHVRHPNIFAIGDCASLPTSKTAAGVTRQVPVLCNNLTLLRRTARRSGALSNPTLFEYDGYTSCPLTTAKDKLILAEFDYTLAPRESFPFDQSLERRSMFLVKRFAMPFLYWNHMIKGQWQSFDYVRGTTAFAYAQKLMLAARKFVLRT